MRNPDEYTDTRQREFDQLPLSDATFDTLFQAPEKDPATLENPGAQE